jgi:DNA-binding winged helix-turn-helix (wHTH) protein
MKQPADQVYEFDCFRVDAANRVLLRNDEVIPLTPKVFEVLLVLIKNRERVLAKDELMQSVWPDVTVEESNLTQSISLLRKALGEQPSDNRFIGTVPKRGYRFLANVTVRQDGAVTLNASSTSTRRPEQYVRGPLLIGGLVVLLAITLAIAGKRFGRNSDADRGLPQLEAVTSLTAPVAGREFYVRIDGTGFNPDTVQIVVRGRGCQEFGSCVVPNNVLRWYGTVTDVQIERVPLKLAPGGFEVFVQNGNPGKPSNGIPLTVGVETGQ